MIDPHVATLHYELRALPIVVLESPPPLQHTTEDFDLHLEDGQLAAQMKKHFADATEARAEVEDFLATWTLHAALVSSVRSVWFEYRSATVIDRAPPPNDGRVRGSVNVTLAPATLSATGSVTLRLRAYPAPPTRFRATPLVNALFQSYRAAVEQQRMASAAAYFAITAIKTRVRRDDWPSNGRVRSDLTADTLGVERTVFNKLFELSTETGDLTTGRKVSDPAELERPRNPHSGDELNWMCEAIRMLATRLGEWEADQTAPLRPILMSDLPKLG